MSVQLTTRQALLLDGVAQGMPISKAGELAGYRSRQNSHDAFVKTRDRLLETMDDVGLTEWDILARVRELMDADKTTVVSRLEGIVKVDTPDNPARIKAIEIAANMRGMLKRDSAPSIGTVNIYWAGNMPNWSAADNQSVTAAESVPEGQLKVLTPPQPPLPASAGSISEGEGVLTRSSKPPLAQRVTKKRKPRLPVYRGEE